MLRNFAASSLAYALGIGLNRGIALLLLPLYTRFLTPGDYGILSACTTAAMAFSMLTLPLDGAVVHYFFKMEAGDYRKLLGTAWVWTTLFPLVVLVVLLLFGGPVASWIVPAVPWDPYLRLALAVGYLGMASAAPLMLLRSQQRPISHSALGLLNLLLQTALLVTYVVILKRGVLGSLHAQLLAAGFMALISHAFLLSQCRPSFDRAHFSAAFRYCLPYLPHNLFMWTLNVSDRLLLARFAPLSELGVYSIAYTAGMAVQFLATALVSAYEPLFYRLHTNPEAQKSVSRLLSALIGTLAFASLAVSILSPEFVRLLTTPGFYGAAGLAPVIALSYFLFGAVYTPAAIVLESHRQTPRLIWVTGPSAALNLILNLVFIPAYGAAAAAASTLLSFALMSFLAFRQCEGLYRLPVDWGAAVKIAFVAILFGAVGWGLPSALGTPLTLLIKVFLLAASGVTIGFFSGFHISDAYRLLAQATRKSDPN